MTNYLASQQIVVDTQDALERTHQIFDELSYQIVSASHKLAKLKGSFKNFAETQ